MCLGIIAPILGMVGSMITANEQQKNAERQAEARNRVLNETLAANDKIAKNSRNTFDKRLAKSGQAQINKDQAAETQKRTATVEKAVSDPQATAAEVPLSGSAPDVVKSAVAKKMLEVFNQGKERARAMGQLGGYGDSWFNQGLASADAGRNLSLDTNYTAGNLGILQPKQDIMELRAYKPISPLGGILQGLGGFMGG